MVTDIINRYREERGNLLPILLDINRQFNWLPRCTLEHVSDELKIPLAEILRVASFYNAFSLVPRGKIIVSVCLGTACHLKGGPRLADALERDLGIKRGQTTDDMLFTLETIRCMGACALAPLVVVGQEYYPSSDSRKIAGVIQELREAEEKGIEVTEEKAPEVVVKEPLKLPHINTAADFAAFRDEVLAGYDPNKPVIIVCHGTGCVANHSPRVAEALRQAIDAAGLGVKVVPEIKTTGCHGFCSRAPLVVMHPSGLFYQNVSPDDAEEIVKTTLVEGKPVERLLAVDHHTGEHIAYDHDIPFYKYQTRIVLRNIGRIDPTDMRDTIIAGGYQALVKVLTTMSPEQVIDTVEASGLRGRGGAGFTTGRKWRICRGVPGEVKYIVGNGDEGDPGAYMDRSIMEGDPHAVIEGMIIGAYAIGANQGHLYVRAEYPLAIKHLGIAMDQARAMGFLGKNILGTGFDFDIKITRGAGAFVCGEETALIRSVMGYVGEPVPRPPYPAQSGLWGMPTVINNVETWASVSTIINRGADWFASIGTETSKGTKVFSLVGRVNHSGLVEVAMGTTLRKIIFDVGGGIPENKDFKAVQIGGPSGGCVTTEFLDLPVDYDSLQSVGSMMGSGGMIVMDSTSCMVDVARYFMSFCYEESCGKCTPCREGTHRMLEILDEITAGRGQEEHLEKLLDMSQLIKDGSLCGLGQTAPNPILSTIKYFRDEYLAHIVDKQCPALVCKRLTPATCQFSCPAGIDVPSYIALIAQGRFAEALNLIREDNPLPSVCGYVCPAPCEAKCKRGEIDRPGAIKYLKRFVSDFVREHGEELPPPEIYRPEKVAVIGSGPGGLAAAYYLALEGYPVTVFEALPVMGGMLRVGIPDFRLPSEVLDFDIQAIAKRGVEFRTNTRIGPDLTLDALTEQGYQAIFLSVGAHQDIRLGIKGEELPGVLSGVEFLRKAALHEPVSLGKRLAVIGGGNVAMDASRTALRMGSAVTIVYRRSRAEMPAYAHEIAQALAEGVEIQFLTQPLEVLGNGQVTGIVCQGMELGEPDDSGRRRPIAKPGTEITLALDGVIKAIGQIPEPLTLSLAGEPLKLTRWGTIETHPVNLSTNLPGIFAGGDVVTGPATVVEAIKAGKQASRSIHRFLQREPLEEKPRIPIPRRLVEPAEISDEERAKLIRPEMPEKAAAERIKDFCLVELGLSESQCTYEAMRCLRCDLTG
ncbi:MAG: NAD(P)H-dependent oxidoreductase subunit E [Desulfobaccales bacterium]